MRERQRVSERESVGERDGGLGDGGWVGSLRKLLEVFNCAVLQSYHPRPRQERKRKKKKEEKEKSLSFLSISSTSPPPLLSSQKLPTLIWQT